MLSVDDQLSMALLVRNDLEMTPGKVAVQCAHAAVDCSLQARKIIPQIFEMWRNTGSRKICLAALDEEDILYWKEKCNEVGLVHSLVRDAGRTEVPSETITVLGVGPAHKTSLDDLFSNLDLYGVE
jgi:PTH2 family peptidyl-tRNA hydrolase